MLTLLGHLAYGLMAFAFITRDLLHLRTLLVVAQVLVIVFAVLNDVVVVAIWNVVYVAVNATLAAQLLRDRRAVRLPDALRPIYERHFSALTTPEFLRLWSAGRREVLAHEPLTRLGERPQWLYFVLDGRVAVRRERRLLAELTAGYFVGEMSLLTGHPANADAEAQGRVEAMRWATADLIETRERDPRMWTKIQAVIGLDLVEKIHLSEARGA